MQRPSKSVEVTRTKTLVKFGFLCTLLQINQASFGVEPGALQIGNFDVTPTLSMDLQDNDNIFRRLDDEQDSLILITAPRIDASLQDGVNRYNFHAEIIDGSYRATSEDDFTDWSIGGEAHMELDSRNIFDLNLRHFSTHENRGTGLSQYRELPLKPHFVDQQEAGLRYQFGNENSNGRLVFDTSFLGYEYTSSTAFTDEFSYDRVNLGGTFYLNVLARTELLFQVLHTTVDYSDDPSRGNPLGFNSRDSDETYAYVGVAWEATGTTTGTIKIGVGEKDFASNSRVDIDEPSYEASLSWAPLSYSILNFNAERSFDESFGLGDAREMTEFGVTWDHNWSTRFATHVGASYQDFDYVGIDLSDTFEVYSAGISYAFARWLDLRMEFVSDTRDTNENLFGYEQNMLVLGFDASL